LNPSLWDVVARFAGFVPWPLAAIAIGRAGVIRRRLETSALLCIRCGAATTADGEYVRCGTCGERIRVAFSRQCWKRAYAPEALANTSLKSPRPSHAGLGEAIALSDNVATGFSVAALCLVIVPLLFGVNHLTVLVVAIPAGVGLISWIAYFYKMYGRRRP